MRRSSLKDAKKRLSEEVENMSFENDRFVKSLDLSDYGFEVIRLASLNKTPKEIEEFLGLDDYTIHKTYHSQIMQGYKLYFETHEWKANMTYKRVAFLQRLRRRLNYAIRGGVE
ncbi:hypothetical protein [Parasutterella excrementihominis]|uniref:hypothetical protein n=1 Tax=Parasutterella excrementihominis TaxID=487175 RepID=UPI00242F069B|nr:hypothetical protein [Parasutterella excrementihominis]